MITKRFQDTVSLLLTCSIVFNLASAQWILDNRCARRRLAGHQHDSSVAPRLWTEGSTLESKRHGNHKSIDLKELDLPGINNATNNHGYWYQNLRGGSSRGKLRRELVDEDSTSFMLRLHWQEGNCWQGEWIERKWCMECASFESRDDCEEGDILWTQFCDNNPGQKFVWVPNLSIIGSDTTTSAVNYGQLKMAYYDLCLERMTTKTYQLQKCDANSANQVLTGWNATFPFELHPIRNSLKCITQHHHPRIGEEIANTFCEKTQHHHTNLWEVYRNDNAGNEVVRLRRPECSERYPCGQCVGDCDSDDDCEGDLICVQRHEDDYKMPVPGCQGFPSTGADYCTLPEHLFAPTIPNHGLRMRERSCSSSNPCMNPCEGDCDDDSDCFGSMKCFMRGGSNPIEEVPNCVGEGEPEADYCYLPEGENATASDNALQTRTIECSTESPCFQCQGDCDGNSDCYGPLECFQRGDWNPMEDIPGCSGTGQKMVDYCYLPQGASLPALDSKNQQDRTNNDIAEEAIDFDD